MAGFFAGSFKIAATSRNKISEQEQKHSMSHATAHSTHSNSRPSNSRLIAVLSDLLGLRLQSRKLGTGGKAPHQHFIAEHFIAQLGKLINFSGAIELSTFLDIEAPVKPQTRSSQTSSSKITKLEKTVVGTEQLDPDPHELFMRTREQMLTFIIRSFAITDRHEQSLYLPLHSDEHFTHEDSGISAYQRFYSLHQSEMELQLTRLLKKIRRCLSSCSPSYSPTLARLAVMDARLNTIMTGYNRATLAIVPKLLAKRFQLLYSTQHDSTIQKTAAAKTSTEKTDTAEPFIADQFITEMRNVLLAELDIRLKPALGLVEAFISTRQTISASQTIKEEKASL